MTRIFCETVTFETFLPYIGEMIERIVVSEKFDKRGVQYRPTLWAVAKKSYDKLIEDSAYHYDDTQAKSFMRFMRLGLMMKMNRKVKEYNGSDLYSWDETLKV